MGLDILKLASAAIGGPIAPVALSIAEEIAGNQLGGANPLGNIEQVLGGFLGLQQPKSSFSPLPSPFSSLSDLPFANPLADLAGSAGLFQSALPALDGALGLFGGTSDGPAASAGAAAGGSFASAAIAATAGGDEEIKRQSAILNDPNSTLQQKAEAQDKIAKIKDAFQLAVAMVSLESSFRQSVIQAINKTA
jgi:hypothetical protein